MKGKYCIAWNLREFYVNHLGLFLPSICMFDILILMKRKGKQPYMWDKQWIGGSPGTAKLHQGPRFPPWSIHWSEIWWSDTSPENHPNASASHLGGSQTCADNTNLSSKEIIHKCLNSALYCSVSKAGSKHPLLYIIRVAFIGNHFYYTLFYYNFFF